MPLSGSGVPSRTDLNNAFSFAIKPDVQKFTASGTWTKPADARFVEVEIQAGGGGSSTASASSGIAVSGGGGGGGYVRALYDADDLGSNETVTVGAGGTGSGTTAAGGDGGTSSFNDASAAGGSGGIYPGAGSTGTGGARGGNGGTVTPGAHAVASRPGSNGGAGRWISGVTTFSNGGGDSMLGVGGIYPTAAGTANNGTGYGGGASGAFATSVAKAGADGAPGVVIVTTYF
ncbi:MAG: hypothetical protein IE926_01940 [Micrococcales bacterium]|nr:hypothetical protein [Micrococcales bacterium]